jgi:hypothetical protein
MGPCLLSTSAFVFAYYCLYLQEDKLHDQPNAQGAVQQQQRDEGNKEEVGAMMMIFITMVQLYKYKWLARKVTVYLDGNGESDEIKKSNLLHAG